jgi:hypothetical protein
MASSRKCARAGVVCAADSGLVAVSASSSYRSLAANLTRASWKDYWSSDQADRNPTLTFDFGKGAVKLAGYTLVSDGHGKRRPLRWAVEVDKQSTWELCGNRAEKFFEVKADYAPVRYARVKMTGPNSYGSNDFRLNLVRFFGTYVAIT